MTEDQVFHFTIRELIEALSSFPPETPVLTSGYENGYENIQQPVLRIWCINRTTPIMMVNFSQ